MSQLLPPLLIALAGLSVVAVLAALWSSLRLLFAAAGSGVAPSMEAATERKALLEEKRALLQSIRDLELERDLGKLSPRDFERLDRQTRARAREVLRALDEQVEPYRARAEALMAEALGEVGDPAEPAPATSSEAPAAAERAACPECGTDNEADAVFCKKCGKRMGEGEGE